MPGSKRGQRHVAEGLPFVGAQVERGFFERRAERPQPRRDHDHHVGNRKRHMRQDHGMQSQPPMQPAERPLEQAPAAKCPSRFRASPATDRASRKAATSRASTGHRRTSVPATVERMVATTAMTRLFQADSASCGSWKIAAIPVQREALPDGKARRIEAEDGQDQQRQMQEQDRRRTA